MRLLGLCTLILLSLGAKPWQKYQLQNACHILDMNGESIKSFPGNYCQFFDDGSYLSASANELSFFTKNREQKWKYSGNFHHHLNLSPSAKEILTLSTLPIKRGKKTLYEDHILILDFNGKLIKEVRASELLNQVKGIKDYSPKLVSHFNSFYEIPVMDTEGLPEYVKAGNYVVNGMSQGILFLSADLKTVLHHEKYGLHQIHDVQILANGIMVYFNNVASESMDNPYSSIAQKNLVTQEQATLFEANPKQLFFSPFRGGVQYLDKDTILFSHILAGTYIYDLLEKKIILNQFKTHLFQDTFYPAQQVKAVDLTNFLSHWK